MMFRLPGRKFLFDLFFGVGIVDAIFLGGLYVAGSYAIYDMPVNAALFVAAMVAFASPARPALARGVAFLTSVFLAILCLTIAAAPLVPKYSPLDLNVRMLHALAGRFFLLGFVPYVVFHVRSEWTGAPRWSRAMARLGWALLKVSLWTAAIMALAVIKGQLVGTHVLLLGLAMPLLVVHVVTSVRRAKAGSAPTDVRPMRLATLVTRRWIGASAAVALGLSTAFVLAFPQEESIWNLLASPEERTLPGVPDLSPSPARLPEGRYLRSQFLGQSASCGVDPCHPMALGGWRESAHRNSASAEYRRELERAVTKRGAPFGRVCAGCHDPVSLYSGQVDFGRGLSSLDGVREGISCMVCHRYRAIGDEPANGALEFTYPDYYSRVPAWTFSMVSFPGEHARDFNGPEVRDDRVCIACHRFRPVDGFDEPLGPADWIERPYHSQPRMTPACRGRTGCVSCHMPRMDVGEKPGSGMPDHRFPVAQPLPTADSPRDGAP